LGTPTAHLTSASQPHSHIRIVPREQLDSDSYEDSTPTFRSSSLQLPPLPLRDRGSRTGSAHSEVSTPINTTFAQMARRSNKNDMEGVEKPTSGPVPLSGFVSFKTHSDGSDNISPTDTRPPAIENHLRLFEQLPDIIRLQEQTGDFDGQVVFIGHPNRDVSAHQWISDSYQWINVGLWSHTRKRIEGSLASDRLATSELSFNSIEYFKFAAERRESMIKEHGRPRTDPEATNTEPTPTEANTDQTSEAPVGSFAATSARTVTGEKLEDPFITPGNILQPAPMLVFNFREGGPTVANPYRGISTLNAAAAPYRMLPKKQSSGESDSSVPAFNIPVSASDPALRFSDPDGRQEHVHPIANGFNKQAPTRQNWSGPFFADSMPTTHDPLASLSAQISIEEKLRNWYRDGQSVIRQQDYAKTLVAAASASNKNRSFAVIGDGSARKQDLSKHANTHLFARVYEHLSEYAEQSRTDGGQSCFTR
ncbi:uncharacterized protein CC84DRAFT_1064023, partial [Paraphaeosphaeria sporulosa]